MPVKSRDSEGERGDVLEWDCRAAVLKMLDFYGDSKICSDFAYYFLGSKGKNIVV